MKKLILSITALSFISACAPASKNIQAQYVSPLQYQSFSCRQLEAEAMRISRKVSEVAGNQDAQASKDSVALGVGLIIFWPALFFMIGEDKKEELARLKGEYDAIEQSAIQKDCSVAKTMQQERQKALEAQKEAEKKAQSNSSKNWN